MALKKKYTTISAGYQITLPDLAYSNIHRLMRNGVTLGRVGNIPPEGSQTFAYDYGTGNFLFGVEATSGPEVILIVYEGGVDVPPELPPGEVCEIPMGVIVTPNDNGTVTLNIPNTGDYRITIGPTSDDCGVGAVKDAVASGPIQLTSNVLPDGDYNLCIRRKCGLETVSDWVTIPFTIDSVTPPPPPEANGRVVNTHPEGVVNSLTPGFFSWVTGPPVPAGETRELFHSGYIGPLVLNVNKTSPFYPQYAYVRVGGTQVYFGSLVNGNNSIPSINLPESDFFEIEYTTIAPPSNLGARKIPADSAIRITGITGIPFVILAGSFPLTAPLQDIFMRHETTGSVQIKAQINMKKNQQVVVALYKNGPLVQFIVVNMNATSTTVTFNPISVTPSDNLFVALDYT